MIDPTRRVQQLIALATDQAATEEEARTAALAACRDIRRNGLQVSPPEGLRGPSERGSAVAERAQNERLLPGGRALPAPRPKRLASSRAPGEPIPGGVHVLSFDFAEEKPKNGNDFAFPQALLRRSP
jgi:hypothetical protein